MEVIYILWLRQIKRYLKSWARIVGSLGQPLLFMVALGFGFGPIYSQAGAGDYIQFLVPGVIAMALLFTSVFHGMEIIWDRQFGFLKEMLVAPVSRLSIMIGRNLGGATVAVFQGVVVLGLSFAIGFRLEHWAMIFPAIGFMFLIALLFTLFGTIIASMLKDIQGFHLIMNFLVMPLFFLSGSFFPLEDVNRAVMVVVKANPLSYGVDALRGTLVGMSHFTLLNDFAILASVTFFLLVLASYAFSRIQA